MKMIFAVSFPGMLNWITLSLTPASTSVGTFSLCNLRCVVQFFLISWYWYWMGSRWGTSHPDADGYLVHPDQTQEDKVLASDGLGMRTGEPNLLSATETRRKTDSTNTTFTQEKGTNAQSYHPFPRYSLSYIELDLQAVMSTCWQKSDRHSEEGGVCQSFYQVLLTNRVEKHWITPD